MQNKDFIYYAHTRSISPADLIVNHLEPSLREANKDRYLVYEKDGQSYRLTKEQNIIPLLNGLYQIKIEYELKNNIPRSVYPTIVYNIHSQKELTGQELSTKIYTFLNQTLYIVIGVQGRFILSDQDYNEIVVDPRNCEFRIYASEEVILANVVPTNPNTLSTVNSKQGQQINSRLTYVSFGNSYELTKSKTDFDEK